jgi:hypothetical protein
MGAHHVVPRRHRCGFKGCAFAGTEAELALHDHRTRHPFPGGSDFEVLTARIQDLCGRYGGHQGLGRCTDCGARLGVTS